jgi:DNA-binding CsgD family transcriptional regulator
MPIIFITGYGNVPTTVQAMKAGAVEFLTKPFGDNVLLSAIRHALDRSHSVLGREAEMQVLRDCYASLTCREREVMTLVVSGPLNKQVGGELGISEITVKAHRGQVMQKMKADSFADLVKKAARLSLRPCAEKLTLHRPVNTRDPDHSILGGLRDGARAASDICDPKMGRSLIEANRVAMSPSSLNSQFSLP